MLRLYVLLCYVLFLYSFCFIVFFCPLYFILVRLVYWSPIIMISSFLFPKSCFFGFDRYVIFYLNKLVLVAICCLISWHYFEIMLLKYLIIFFFDFYMLTLHLFIPGNIVCMYKLTNFSDRENLKDWEINYFRKIWKLSLKYTELY